MAIVGGFVMVALMWLLLRQCGVRRRWAFLWAALTGIGAAAFLSPGKDRRHH